MNLTDHELGLALVVAGARAAGRDVDQAVTRLANEPHVADEIGRACRPLLEQLASSTAELLALFDDPRLVRVLRASVDSPVGERRERAVRVVDLLSAMAQARVS